MNCFQHLLITRLLSFCPIICFEQTPLLNEILFRNSTRCNNLNEIFDIRVEMKINAEMSYLQTEFMNTLQTWNCESFYMNCLKILASDAKSYAQTHTVHRG